MATLEVVAKPQRQRKKRTPRRKRAPVVLKEEVFLEKGPVNGPRQQTPLRKQGVPVSALSGGGTRDFDPIDRVQPRGKVNPYLLTLIDPERFHGVRYPDSYKRATAILKLIQNLEVPYIPSGMAPGVEEPGKYFAIFRASLLHPVWFYGVYDNGENPLWNLSTQNERFGLRSLLPGVATVAQQDGMMWLPKNVTLNMVAAMIFQTLDYVIDPFKRKLPDGSLLYGYTFAGGSPGAGMTVNFQIRTNGKVSNGDIIRITMTNGTTSVVTDLTATAADQNEWSGTSTTVDVLLTATTLASLGHACGRPASVGFRIGYISAAGVNKGIEILSVAMKLNFAGGTPPTAQLGLYPQEWEDVQDLLGELTRYRPVSASAWCAYEGSTLNNGGAHAALMYQGGEHPAQAGLYEYELIARIPESYEQRMSMGSYQYIVPASTADTEMRQVVNQEEWNHPYCVFAGRVGDITQTRPLRLRVVMNPEFVSDSQLFNYQSVPPLRWQIDQAQRILFNAPTSMSNDGHWEQIWKWMKQAGRDVASFAKDNAHWIAPIAKGLATTGLALL